MGRSNRTPLARALLVALMLCVFAVRVIVPQGFMWATGADGSPRMVECSGMGPMPAPVAHQHGHQHGQDGKHDHDGKTGDHICAFAAASLAVDLAGDFHPAATHVAPTAAPVALHIFARPGLGLAAPPPPKTGPPAAA